MFASQLCALGGFGVGVCVVGAGVVAPDDPPAFPDGRGGGTGSTGTGTAGFGFGAGVDGLDGTGRVGAVTLDGEVRGAGAGRAVRLGVGIGRPLPGLGVGRAARVLTGGFLVERTGVRTTPVSSVSELRTVAGFGVAAGVT